MSKKLIFIVGAGGHSKVVTETINTLPQWEIVAYIDENPTAEYFMGKPLYTDLDSLRSAFPSVTASFVAIGNNLQRKAWHHKLQHLQFMMPYIVHPSANLSASATVHGGTFVAAGVIVNSSALIGEGVILNIGSLVDHDCQVGNFCHISQGAILCGGARVNPETVVLPGCVVHRESC